MKPAPLLVCVLVACCSILARATEPVTLKVSGATKSISSDLFGVFFEDINYSADGGLYAELIQNRSFDYSPIERTDWNALSFWEVVRRDGGEGNVALDLARPLHPNNPHYAVLEVGRVGGGVGLCNAGFDGVPVEAGKSYRVSFFAMPLYLDQRWGGRQADDKTPPHRLVARLESKDGKLLGETVLEIRGSKWQQVAGQIEAKESDADARFVLLSETQGGIALDMISVFPTDTFNGRENGLRRDLAEAIADLHPKFVRFPGGCLVHGNGLPNMYRWKDTVGPIQERRAQPNLWGYHQTVGLGYFEYFQFCEDIGAKPMPIVPAAVSCQNSAHTAGAGQDGLPMDEMPAYIQELIDLVEWANGPPTSRWGAVRAAAGHPEPFGLEYLGVGNEDHITPEFEERFEMIYEALRERCPEITVIGTVGPFPDGDDWDAGWRIANRLRVPIVDEHYYKPPGWFLENAGRYDVFDRSRSKVYVGEYAAHDHDRQSTLRSALAEAAYMTQLERNGDVVAMASYAPLLAKNGHTQWRPDLVYFDNQAVYPTINYYVQKLFGVNSGDKSLSVEVPPESGLFASAVYDSPSGEAIIKIVNPTAETKSVRLDLSALPSSTDEATQWTLSGDPLATNPSHQGEVSRPVLRPVESKTTVGTHAVAAHSLTVLRFPCQAEAR
jgi:alpha-L-arabinofuranosidase